MSLQTALTHLYLQTTERLRSSPIQTCIWTMWRTTMRRQPAWLTSPPLICGKTSTHESTCSTTTSPKVPAPFAAWATSAARPSTAAWSAHPAARSTSGCMQCHVLTSGTNPGDEWAGRGLKGLAVWSLELNYKITGQVFRSTGDI